jgi:hypothetical protein
MSLGSYPGNHTPKLCSIKILVGECDVRNTGSGIENQMFCRCHLLNQRRHSVNKEMCVVAQRGMRWYYQLLFPYSGVAKIKSMKSRTAFVCHVHNVMGDLSCVDGLGPLECSSHFHDV